MIYTAKIHSKDTQQGSLHESNVTLFPLGSNTHLTGGTKVLNPANPVKIQRITYKKPTDRRTTDRRTTDRRTTDRRTTDRRTTAGGLKAKKKTEIYTDNTEQHIDMISCGL